MSVFDKLKDLGLKIEYSTAENREPIDFQLRDENDNLVLECWGSGPDDAEWECEHDLIEWGDDDEQGECKICGARCDWAWVPDMLEAADEEGNYTANTIVTREPSEWYKDAGGVVQEILNYYKENW